jgi:hypothetical protein
VETTERGFSFDPGMLGVMKVEQQNQHHPAEIWVYVPEGVKRLTIQHPRLGVLRDKDLGLAVGAAQTYVMQLATGHVQVMLDEQPTTQWVLFRVEPKDAIVMLDGQMLKTTDGTAQKMMAFGTYHWRVQAPDCLPEAGQVLVNNPDSTVEVVVRLKPNIAQVTLCVDNNAEIWVNGELMGRSQWTGQLSTGVYVIEAKLASHRTTRMERQVDVVPGGDTIHIAAPQPICGSVEISSTPAVADIYIDGQKMGRTPQRVQNLLIGHHALCLKREGYADRCDTIVIREGQTASYEATLLKGQLKALLAQQPVAQQTARAKSLPAWAVQPQTDRWLGISPPTADAQKGRRAAITAAILHYARSMAGGQVRQLVKHHIDNNGYSGENSSAAEGLQSLEQYEWADRYMFAGFECQVEEEYYNADGEYFVLCYIKDGGNMDTRIRVERSCSNNVLSYAGETTGLEKLDAVVTLTEQGDTLATLDCCCFFDDNEKKAEYILSSDDSYFEQTDGMGYKVKRASVSLTPAPSQTFAPAQLAASLGTVRLAALLFLPYIPDTISVTSLYEMSDDGNNEKYHGETTYGVNGACHATPASFFWTGEGYAVTLSDVNLDSSTFRADNWGDVVCDIPQHVHPIARMAAIQGNMAASAALAAQRQHVSVSSNVTDEVSKSSYLSKLDSCRVGIAWSDLSKAILMRFEK